VNDAVNFSAAGRFRGDQRRVKTTLPLILDQSRKNFVDLQPQQVTSNAVFRILTTSGDVHVATVFLSGTSVLLLDVLNFVHQRSFPSLERQSAVRLRTAV
jgi:hypothetical protein